MSTSAKTHRFQQWFKNIFVRIRSHPKASLIIGGVLAIVITSGVAIALTYQKPVQKPLPTPTTTKPKVSKKPTPKPKFYSPLTGEEVANEAATSLPVSAVMIENSPQARPQSGLGSAEIVYEAIAEGGITRFLALYQQHKPELVGPVRSVRMYYIDWLAPYDASVFHVGGSLYALQEIRNGNYRDMDQFFNSGSYWRSSDRYAPHNVYTNFEKIDALNTAKGYTSSHPQPLKRADSNAAKTPNATSVDVKISSALYNSHYDYDAASNLYLRSQAGEPHTDTVAGRISPRVVVVMKTDMQPVMEDGIREDYRTTGTGEAWVFQDGTVTQATWHKQDRQHQLFFTDSDGKELTLARGTTWFTAVPMSGGVSWQ